MVYYLSGIPLPLFCFSLEVIMPKKKVSPPKVKKEPNVKAILKNRQPQPFKRTKREYTSGIPQEDLAKIKIFAPLSIKQEKYLNDEENDIVVWGGAASAGKTQLSLLRLMLAGLWDGDYVAAIARKSQKMIKNAGSLWSTGCKEFAPYGIKANKLDLAWTFPSGAEVKCHHLDNNTDDWQGTQCTEFLIDEAQQCNEDDCWYLTSRLRSQSKRKHQLRMTCNPLNTSFLCKWLVKAGYIGDDGLPKKEMDGVTTWMLQINGTFEWYSSKKAVEEAYGKEVADMALKFVFYSANVYDNPYIRKWQPQYIHKLENLKTIERRRLLLGDWFAKLETEGYVKREWFNEVKLSEIPLDMPTVRCWDLAATKPSAANKDPDWTRGTKCTYDKKTGYFYILDMVSIRDRPALVQSLIEKTASEDGKDVFIGIPVDGGAGGKEAADTKRARLLTLGHKVILNKTNKRKLARAEPFLVALQQGKVFVAPGVFEDVHYQEMENFDGAKCSGWHDDIIDTLADCFNTLTSNTLIPSIRLGTDLNRISAIGGRTLL